MRILFLSQVLPYPLDAGPKVRAYYVLRRLAAAGHQVTLLSFIRRSDRPEHVQHLGAFCHAVHTAPMHRSRWQDAWRLLGSLASSAPFLIARDRAPAMNRRLHDLVSEAQSSRQEPPFHVIHADQLWMAPYARQAQRWAGSPAPKLVLDQHNAVHLIPQRLARHESNPAKRALLALEGRKLARYEAGVCRQFDRVVWVSDSDRSALRQQTGDRQFAALEARFATIPICVDPGQPLPASPPADAPRVTFLGGLHWPPNAEGILWFIRQVWPHVHRQAPGAVLTVIGQNPPARLVQSNAQIANLHITGYVADPTPYLQETAVFIVPLHAGGGMRVKILDAWRWGLPVVSTTIGAEGIDARHGDDLLLADSASAQAEAVVRLLHDRELARRLVAGGRRRVEQDYNWRTAYRAWDALYSALGP